MIRFVLDCSVAVSWCFEDERAPFADSLLDLLADGGEAVVPSLWHLEIANAMLAAERRKRITRVASVRFLEHLNALPIVCDPEIATRATGSVFSLAGEYGLSVYDAAYLELAIRKGIPMATLDRALAAAADRCGVLMKAR